MNDQEIQYGKPYTVTNKLTYPVETGWYFVKEKKANYWFALVKLEGEAPFMRVTNRNILFNREDSKLLENPNELTFSERILLSKDELN